MNKPHTLFVKLAAAFLLALAGTFYFESPAAAEEENIADAFKNGDFIFDGRVRYENVRNASFATNAEGLTFRARFGFQTASFHNFVLLAEGEFTRDIGVNNFNSTVNGKVGFPVIADPDSAELNRVSITYKGIEKTTIAAGRQRLILDNHRFVGNVGFRQNEQTFDSLMVQTKIIDGVTFTYIYVFQVNRIFGSQSPVGQLDTNTHLFNVSYDKLPIGKITGYAYLINIDGAAAASNQTYGMRLTGSQNLGNGVKVVYVAGFALQEDYKNSPVRFSEGFFEFEGGLTYHGAVAKVGYEILKGNGAQSFRTPLATGHKFQGFADVFLATPAAGIKDLYFIAGYTAKDVPLFKTVTGTVWYHDFTPDIAGPDLGEEVDFRITVAPEIAKQKVKFEFLFADFSGSPILPDVRKYWITMGVAF